MPKREQLVTGNYYHIINRGIEGRNIFWHSENYNRFLESLKVFNDSNLTTIQLSRKVRKVSDRVANQNPLVKIICFCLLPNHFHLLLKQLQDDGIRKFMHKVSLGYAGYFNLKYNHSGPIFRGRFKSVHIKDDVQFLHVSRYIHLNVLDLISPDWRNGKLVDWERAKQFLESYPWSSYQIFVQKKSSDFCDPELFREIFKTPIEYENFVKSWTERDLIDFPFLCAE